MIKCGKIKPIILDTEKHILNLNNWSLTTKDDWGELEYIGEESQHIDVELEWDVNGQTITTDITLHHTWTEDRCEGDYWTPPSCDVIDESVDVYIISIYNCDTDVEYDVDKDFIYQDLYERLGYYIQDKYYFG
jgi:hypothetical protein